ncbi:MAG: hypothetical protein J7L41_02560, partial [Synergistetes bacterium]|nr:hypothetical protein [Synergistota bacterium]
DTTQFFIYSVKEGGEYELLKKVENTAIEEEEEGKHGSTAKMKKIISMLPSVEVFVGKVLSPNFIKMSQSTDIQPIVVKRESIEECLQVISQNFQTIYELTEKRKAGKREQVVPAFE